MRQYKRYQQLCVILCGLCLSVPMHLCAATKEQAVKAGFIYNLAKFTTWPDTTPVSETFNVCTVGDDHLGGALGALVGKPVHGKPLAVHHNPKEKALAFCHIAFVTKSKSSKALQMLHRFPVLTVSDAEHFIHRGGMIGLVRNGRYLGFEVNVSAIREVSLNVSAQLLKLAKKVKGLK